MSSEGAQRYIRGRSENLQRLYNLEEALEIAERGSMKLHECDVHLEWGRLRLSTGDRDGARQHLERAAALVEETGYHRRDGEVRELREACS